MRGKDGPVKQSIIVDSVYMLVNVENSAHPSVLYCAPARTIKEAWANVETLGITGGDKAYWRKRGYRAQRVTITLEETDE